jgi:hypothetical protein
MDNKESLSQTQKRGEDNGFAYAFIIFTLSMLL